MPVSEVSESHGSHEHNSVESNRYHSLYIGSQARELYTLLSSHKGEIVSLEEIQKCIGHNYKNAKAFSTQLTKITDRIRGAIADKGLDIRRVYGRGIILFDADATKNFILFTPLESLTLEYLIAHSPEFCSARDIFHAIKPDGSLPPDYRKHVGNFIAGIRSKSTAWLILSQRGSHAGYRAIPVNSETASRKPDSPSTQG